MFNLNFPLSLKNQPHLAEREKNEKKRFQKKLKTENFL